MEANVGDTVSVVGVLYVQEVTATLSLEDREGQLRDLGSVAARHGPSTYLVVVELAVGEGAAVDQGVTAPFARPCHPGSLTCGEVAGPAELRVRSVMAWLRWPSLRQAHRQDLARLRIKLLIIPAIIDKTANVSVIRHHKTYTCTPHHDGCGK